MWFAKTGGCNAENCEFAHVEVKGARGGKGSNKRRYNHIENRWERASVVECRPCSHQRKSAAVRKSSQQWQQSAAVRNIKERTAAVSRNQHLPQQAVSGQKSLYDRETGEDTSGQSVEQAGEATDDAGGEGEAPVRQSPLVSSSECLMMTQGLDNYCTANTDGVYETGCACGEGSKGGGSAEHPTQAPMEATALMLWHCAAAMVDEQAQSLRAEESAMGLRQLEEFDIALGAESNQPDARYQPMVAMDSCATVGVIGCREIPYVVRSWDAPAVRVYTGNKSVVSSKMGALPTEQGEFTGYIIPESMFSLWPMEREMDEGGVYKQWKGGARMEYPDGSVRHFTKRQRLWSVKVCDDCDAEFGFAAACGTVSKGLIHAIKGHPHDPKCTQCLQGRMRSKPRRRVKLVRTDQRGITVYLDLMGPFEEDLLGNVYEMTITEGKHGWIEVNGIKDKSSESTSEKFLDAVRDVMARSNQRVDDVGRVHTDQGKEFKGNFEKVVRGMSAVHSDTGGYNSSTNPAEGAQGRLQQTARAILADGTGGHQYYKEFRGFALKRAAYCINRCDEGATESAYRKAWGKDYDWNNSNEHTFLCRCLYKPHDKDRQKFESVAEVAVWLGYNTESNQHIVCPLEGWDGLEQRYMLGKPTFSRTVRAFDDQFPLRCIPTADADLKKFNDFVDAFDPQHQHAPVPGDGADRRENEYEVKAIIGTRHRGRAKRYIVEWEGGGVTVEPKDNLSSELVDEYETKVKAAAAAIVGEGEMNDMERMVAELMLKQKASGTVEEWLPGVQEEFDTVKGLRFEEVDEATAAQVRREGLAMKLRMILEAKKDGRRKGRLVGQGFWEAVGVTGANVDSPVASFAAVRMLLFMAGRAGEVIASGDISKAFLKSDEYSPDAAPRYVTFRMYKGGPEHVWRLRGPLYGSRDSPRLWYQTFVKFMSKVQSLIDQGFELDGAEHSAESMQGAVNDTVNAFVQGKNEPCCFRHPVTGLKVVLFVDDIITRGMPDVTEQFYRAIDAEYPLRSWSVLKPGQPIKHLSFTITEHVKDGKTYRYMSQCDDVRTFMSDHGIELDAGVTCPMPDKSHIYNDTTPLSTADCKDYKSLVGGLSWFAISLRYDIAHSVTRLQQYNDSPTVGAMNAAIRVAAYVGSTADFRLGGAVQTGENTTRYYSDSDHGGDRGMTTRSHTGVMLLLNNVPVHWRSKKQPKTVVSPAHAEIYACSEAVREARWLQWVARDLGMDLSWPFVVQVDNKQVISFKYSTCATSKLRGMIDLRWNWVQELRDDKLVEVEKVSTKNNLADMLTKCLTNVEFNRQISQINEDFRSLELGEQSNQL